MNVLQGMTVFHHSAIKIQKSSIIYIDPYQITKEYHDADYIFITHEHYDHFSPEDILKVMKKDTIFVSVPKTKSTIATMQPDEKRIILVKPNESYQFRKLQFTTTVAYNKKKLFHQKEKEWVGYIITIDGIDIYIAGDTDDVEELEDIHCDIAFLPIGGTYTMNIEEASNLANAINPKILIPTHYNLLEGTHQDPKLLREKVNSNIRIEVLIK